MLTSDIAPGQSLGRLTWRRLAGYDLPGLTGLCAHALAIDGGQPFAADDMLLRRWYIDDVEDSMAAFDGDQLVGACAWRYVSVDGERRAVIVGQVAPESRRQGIGKRLLDGAMDSIEAGAQVRVETESLTAGAEALYRSRGLTCVFAEDVMTIALSAKLPSVATSADVAFTEWSEQVASRFFAVYDAAFRTRPGFPNWTADEWISRISDDADFRPGWTLLATVDDLDVGFIAGATGGRRGGWIVQVGVVPAARRQSVASALIVEVLRRMRAGGELRAVLNVNVNNPGAIKAYRRLGFGPAGRRAAYEPARLTAPWQPH